MRNIAIVDETFDINITESYHLSVEISKNGISYAILDTIRKKYIALKTVLFEKSHPSSHEEQIIRLFRTDNYLNKKYKSSGIIYANSHFSLVPDPLFERDKAEELFRFSNHLRAGHVIQSNKISSIDAWIIFALPQEILDALGDNPNKFKIIHQSFPLIEGAFMETKGKAGETMVYAQVYEDFFDMLVFKKGKLDLYNTFSFKTDKDLIFYLLYVYEQLGMNTSEVGISLSGQIDKSSDMIDQLSQFLPNIHFMPFNRNFAYSYTFGQVNQYQFTNLINLYRCV